MCHIYLTVPQDLSTQMIVNFHLYSSQPANPIVYYGKNETSMQRTCLYYCLTFFCRYFRSMFLHEPHC